MPNPVPPPKHGLVDDRDVTPRKHSQLVSAIMELRNCSKPDAEAFIDEAGAEAAERCIRSRWE